MCSMKGLAILTIGVLAVAALGPAQAQAQGRKTLTYSVKFLCGFQDFVEAGTPATPKQYEVRPGYYATAINIHNFHSSEVRFQKKAVVADPQRFTRGPKSNAVDERLGSGDALEVDCIDIVQLFPKDAIDHPLAPRRFIKGFLQIISQVELSVVAVYTAQGCQIFLGTGACPSSLEPLALDVVPQTPFNFQPPLF